jgi:hypothetical protein
LGRYHSLVLVVLMSPPSALYTQQGAACVEVAVGRRKGAECLGCR